MSTGQNSVLGLGPDIFGTGSFWLSGFGFLFVLSITSVVVQSSRSAACVCLSVRAMTFNKMTLEVEIWHGG